jgi:hypothetical protein
MSGFWIQVYRGMWPWFPGLLPLCAYRYPTADRTRTVAEPHAPTLIATPPVTTVITPSSRAA